MTTRLGAIVLAAGKSTRMGENKLLMKVDGQPMIRRVVEACIRSRVNLVAVVLGHDEQAIRRALEGLRCRLVFNPQYERGQSFSLRAGLSAVRAEIDAMLVIPGDVALVSTDHINAVVDEYYRHDGRILVASHRGRSGHPILIDSSLFDEVAGIDEANYGLKAVVNAHRDVVRKVEVGALDVLLDIDTRGDYEKFVLGKETK